MHSQILVEENMDNYFSFGLLIISGTALINGVSKKLQSWFTIATSIQLYSHSDRPMPCLGMYTHMPGVDRRF